MRNHRCPFCGVPNQIYIEEDDLEMGDSVICQSCGKVFYLTVGNAMSSRSRKKRNPVRKMNGMVWKLVSLTKSKRRGKKLQAIFENRKTGRRKTTHFGAARMSDFTKHKDAARRLRYLRRHQKRENWQDPTSAGALSRWVLWNKRTLKASVADFKRRFKLGQRGRY